MTRFALPSIAAFALGSCGQPPDVPTPSEVVRASDTVPIGDGSARTIPPFGGTSGDHPAMPEPAPVPARFRGTWANSKNACADPKHNSRLSISDRTLRYFGFVISGDNATSTANQFAPKGKIEGSGRPAEAQFFINEAGDVLTDGVGGGAVRVRCG